MILLSQSSLCIQGGKYCDSTVQTDESERQVTHEKTVERNGQIEIQVEKTKGEKQEWDGESWETEEWAGEKERNVRNKWRSPKKRKVDSENRAFNPEWTHFCSYFPLEALNLCVSYVQKLWHFIKSANVKRHYETKHKAFEQTYPLKSEVRSQKIRVLRTHNTYRHTYMFSSMLRDNKYCQKVFELYWINLIWQSGIEYMQLLIQQLGYLNIYHTK